MTDFYFDAATGLSLDFGGLQKPLDVSAAAAFSCSAAFWAVLSFSQPQSVWLSCVPEYTARLKASASLASSAAASANASNRSGSN